MKDLFGNKKPIQIEIEEWWYNGRIIQKQTHPLLLPYISFADDGRPFVEAYFTFKEAKEFCQSNPCLKSGNFTS